MSKSEKNAFFSKPFNGPILIFWNLILYTFLCTKIKKFTIVHFFSLDACSRPMWEMLSIGSYDILVLSLCCNDISNLTSTPINLHLFFAETSGLNTLHIAENALCRFPELKKVVILDPPPRIDSRNLASLSRHRSDYLAWRLPKSPHSSKIAFKSLKSLEGCEEYLFPEGSDGIHMRSLPARKLYTMAAYEKSRISWFHSPFHSHEWINSYRNANRSWLFSLRRVIPQQIYQTSTSPPQQSTANKKMLQDPPTLWRWVGEGGGDAKTCWDGPDKMPTKKLIRTKCQPQKKSHGQNANLGWHFVRLAFCPVGILSYHRQPGVPFG